RPASGTAAYMCSGVEVIHSKKWKSCTQDYLRPKISQKSLLHSHNSTKTPAANDFLYKNPAAGGTYPYKVEVTFSIDLIKKQAENSFKNSPLKYLFTVWTAPKTRSRLQLITSV
ncbi:MAG: hypothetical protein IJV59_07260, partial [Eubacterium sp.]|nr:hypothetical protein [Eubacterium sp.]